MTADPAVPTPRPAPEDAHACHCPDCRLADLLARKEPKP